VVVRGDSLGLLQIRHSFTIYYVQFDRSINHINYRLEEGRGSPDKSRYLESVSRPGEVQSGRRVTMKNYKSLSNAESIEEVRASLTDTA